VYYVQPAATKLFTAIGFSGVSGTAARKFFAGIGFSGHDTLTNLNDKTHVRVNKEAHDDSRRKQSRDIDTTGASIKVVVVGITIVVAILKAEEDTKDKGSH
jgi:hypothetical protein